MNNKPIFGEIALTEPQQGVLFTCDFDKAERQHNEWVAEMIAEMDRSIIHGVMIYTETHPVNWRIEGF